MFGPGLHIRQYSSDRAEQVSTLCYCSCHHPEKPPPAVEARLCQACADERFQDWQPLIDRLMRND